jgi:hypothetical protein
LPNNTASSSDIPPLPSSLGRCKRYALTDATSHIVAICSYNHPTPRMTSPPGTGQVAKKQRPPANY